MHPKKLKVTQTSSLRHQNHVVFKDCWMKTSSSNLRITAVPPNSQRSTVTLWKVTTFSMETICLLRLLIWITGNIELNLFMSLVLFLRDILLLNMGCHRKLIAQFYHFYMYCKKTLFKILIILSWWQSSGQACIIFCESCVYHYCNIQIQ